MGDPAEPAAGTDHSDQLKAMLEAVRTPEELRTLLEAPGVTSDVINEFTARVGVDNVLDRVFSLMGSRFLADRAGSESGVVQWNITTADGIRSYRVTIGGGTATAARGVPEKARVTLGLTMPNLLRLCAGKLNGVTAVMTGKVKISGDMMFGARMQGWFDY